MDVIKAPNLFDSFLLTLVFFCSFLLANSWTETTKAFFRDYVSPQDRPKDWFLFSVLISLLVVILLFILRKLYH